MTSVKKFALAAVALAFVAGTLGACKKEETPGTKLDNAMDKAKEAGADAKKEAEKAAPK